MCKISSIPSALGWTSRGLEWKFPSLYIVPSLHQGYLYCEPTGFRQEKNRPVLPVKPAGSSRNLIYMHGLRVRTGSVRVPGRTNSTGNRPNRPCSHRFRKPWFASDPTKPRVGVGPTKSSVPFRQKILSPNPPILSIGLRKLAQFGRVNVQTRSFINFCVNLIHFNIQINLEPVHYFDL
jgi:hypothetical protein